MGASQTERAVSKRKAAGAHFTPPELARFIALRLVAELGTLTKPTIRVLDPSCGEGELLLAIQSAAPKHIRQRLTLIGVEADEASLGRAEQRLRDAEANFECVRGDFLELTGRGFDHPVLFETPALPPALRENVDVIIANPPYVRTQILGAAKAQSLARTFGLTGRVDLYHAFVVAMTERLVETGLLGIITSNRFLTTKGGASVRQFLAREFDLIELLDLGDTKLFEAAVLPAICFARRTTSRRNDREQTFPFLRIYAIQDGDISLREAVRPARSVIDILEKSKAGRYFTGGKSYQVKVGTLSIEPDGAEPWAMVTEDEQRWLDEVNALAEFRICDVAKVRVGIKTTADSVFIRADWNQLPKEVRPENELLHPLLSQENVKRWHSPGGRSSKRLVLYPHQIERGRRCVVNLAQYPRAARYLEMHRTTLEARRYVREAGREWYEIWVPQDPAAWRLPKLVFPDISPEPRFCFDPDGCLVDGNCYWITLIDGVPDDVLFMILALANSQLMTRYHELTFQNKLYAGRRRYLSQYVEKYPIPSRDSIETKRLANLGKTLAFDSADANSRDEVEREIELLLASAFGVDSPVAAMG